MKKKLLLVLLIASPVTIRPEESSLGIYAARCAIKSFCYFTASVASTLTAAYIIHKNLVKPVLTPNPAAPQKEESAQISMTNTTFNQVAGAHEAKSDLEEIVGFLRNPEKYHAMGAKIPHGVLLTGAPGNGKTLLARAVAGEAHCPFIYVNGSEFIEMYVGIGAKRVRELFQIAHKNSPCIIFIDEIDSIGVKRNQGPDGGGLEHHQTLNQLLSEMDGFAKNDAPVILLAATNRPDVLDEALLRPGRFDRRVEVPYPDLMSRQEILELHAEKVTLDRSVDLAQVASGTPGFSGAELANLVNEAALIATKRNAKAVFVDDFEEARDRLILGRKSKTTILTEHDRESTAYHEAGHALVRLLIPEHTDPLYKVTIAPRGRTLGVTHSLPERERYSSTKEELLALITVCLAGRVAEEITFGEVATGAHNDFQKATAIARSMVCDYGMSEELGVVVYTTCSPKTATRIDQAVRKIIDQCYQEAHALLYNNLDKLELLARKLLEKETLYADEIYRLLGVTPRNGHRFAVPLA